MSIPRKQATDEPVCARCANARPCLRHGALGGPEGQELLELLRTHLPPRQYFRAKELLRRILMGGDDGE